MIMPRYRRLTYEERLKIIFMVERGDSYSKIAKEMSTTPGAISKIISKKKDTGNVADKQRSGRPRKTTPREDRILVRTCLENRRLSALDIQKKIEKDQGIHLGKRTVQKRLSEAGLRGCVAVKKPLLSDANCSKRLKFAREHKNWTVNDWKKVLFSDESSFELFCGDKRRYVRRRVGERFKKECCVPTVKHGSGTLMVWGCMSGFGVGRLHRCIGTVRQDQYIQILQDSMLPSSSDLFGEENQFIFMQDNAPCHKAKKVTDFLRQKGVQVLDWPAQSPDMNPIENLWEILFQKVKGSNPKNFNELWEALQTHWNSIPQATIDRLIESMPSRMHAVIKAHGWNTKY